jgi:sporulation protein YlmC with PRC-barrel domain
MAFHENHTGSIMRDTIRLLPAALVVATMLSSQVFAQGTPQTTGIARIDPTTVTTGFRASKVIGATVVNDHDQTIGTIDDLIVTPTEQVPFAVLSVGGFLGMGTKYIVIPYSALKAADNKMVLFGATKDSIKALPEFKYAS